MRKAGWCLNFFEKRPRPADVDDESVAAIVRLPKSRHAKTEVEKDAWPSSERNDDVGFPGRR